MTFRRMLLAAICVAGLSTQPAAATGLPANVLFFLQQIGYLAPLSGVTLTTDQTAAIEQIEIAGWTALVPQLKAALSAHEQIIAALSQPTVDTAAIMKLEKQKANALAVIEVSRIKMAIKVHNVLTPSQLAQEASTHTIQLADLIVLINSYFPGTFH